MQKTKFLWGIIVALALSLISIPSSEAAPQKRGNVLVGHVSHTQGQLLYFVPENNDWVAAVTDAPFGIDDAFYSGEDGKAEFIMPNRTRLRIGPTTQVQLITLQDDLTQVDVASGTARFFNDSNQGVIKVTTPFGYAVAEKGAVFDLYVGDDSVEVIPIEGTVDYVGNQGSSKYDLEAGSSIIAAASLVTDGEGTVDSDWESWNEQRDGIRTKRLAVKGDSVKYLPDGLDEEAYALEEHGKWETVQYEGAERRLWRPTGVGADWEPYTAGRWTSYHGDNAWIPEEESFGYVTHHYGNWVYLDDPGYWYWNPPVVAAQIGAVGIAFSWYPGRVGWIHSGFELGWFPLAPHEPFYAHRFWGPRTVVVSNVTNVNININNFRYVNRAVVVPQADLFAARNYRNVRIRNLNRETIARNFRPTPLVNERVIRNFRQNNQRFQFVPGRVDRVPHNEVVRRIRQNQRIAARSENLRAATVQQNLRRLRQGEIVRNASVQKPRVSDRLVMRTDAGKARQEVKFQQRELKRQAVQLQRTQERQQRARELRQQRQQQQMATPRQRGQLLEQQRDQRTQRLQQQRQERAQNLRQRRQEQVQAQQQRRQQALQQQQQRRQNLEQQRAQRTQRLQQQRQERAQNLQQRRQERAQVQQQRRQQALQQQQRSGQQAQIQQQRRQQAIQQQQRSQQLQQQRQRQSQVQQQRRQQALQQQQRSQQQAIQQQRRRQAQIQQQQRSGQQAQIQQQRRQQALQQQQQAIQQQRRQQALQQQQRSQQQAIQQQRQRQAQIQQQQRQQAVQQQRSQQQAIQQQRQRQAQIQQQQRQQAVQQQQRQQALQLQQQQRQQAQQQRARGKQPSG